MSAPVPYWRLSSFYLFYFATLGALVPYWSVYLRSLEFTASEIGELMALLMFSKMIAPNIWGWVADRLTHQGGRRLTVVRLASLFAAAVFSLSFVSDTYWEMALLMVGFSFFWHAALPQFEATTMNHLGANHHSYAKIRLWGSVGFILTVVGVGELLDLLSANVLLPVVFLLLVAIWLSSMTVPDNSAHAVQGDDTPIWSLLRRPEVISLLLMSFLLQMSHGPYYTFFTLYLQGYGYSTKAIGLLWALGVIAEILLFLKMAQLLQLLGSRRLLIIALTLAALRWGLLAEFPDSLWILLFIQVLHAASFGVIHAVSIHLTHKYFVGRNQGRGQALYSSLSFGAGGALGNLAGGYLWQDLGPSWTYGLAAVMALLAMAVTWIWAEKDRV